MDSSINININGREVSVPAGITVLEAARAHHIHIPTLCHHPALSAWGGCRMCLVEVDEAPRLAASCVLPVRPGMRVMTHNQRIWEARRTVLECLFAEGEHQCMICARSGDCELQALAYEHGLDHLGIPRLEGHRPTDLSHPRLFVDHGRCVLCGRCVRACRELAGVGVLDFHFRGGRTRVGADLNLPLGESSCISCGACQQVCPTGAISLRQRTHLAIAGKKRDWRVVESLCPSCGLLCPTHNLVRAGVLLKVESPLRPTDGLSRSLCPRGRFAPLDSPAPRARRPLIRQGEGPWREADWAEAYDLAAAHLAPTWEQPYREDLRAVISSDASWEELQDFQAFVTEDLGDVYLDCADGAAARMLSQAALAAGVKVAESPPAEVAQADCVLLVGAGLEESHPLPVAWARRALLDHGADLIGLAGARDLTDGRGLDLAATQKDWVSALERLCQLVAKPGHRRGESPLDRAARALAQARRPFILAGGELWRQPDSHCLEMVLHLAALLGGEGQRVRLPLSLCKPAGNSAASWRMGLVASQPPGDSARFRAGLRCLASPQDLASPWTPDWSGLEFSIVLTPWFSSQLATLPAGVILPKPSWLESDGAYSSLDQAAPQAKPRVLEPLPGVASLATSLDQLGRRLAGRQAASREA